MHINKGHYFFIQSIRFVLVGLFSVIVGAVDQMAGQLLDGADSGVNAEVRLHVPSVQVIARHARPIVPNYHTVWINHGHDFEDNALSKLFGLVGVAQEALDETLHHI